MRGFGVSTTPCRPALAAYHLRSCSLRVRAGLTRSSTVTEAIYDAGFNSNGSFYATSSKVLGVTPTDYRAGVPTGAGDSSCGFVTFRKTWSAKPVLLPVSG